MRIIITGASGVLGSAVRDAFERTSHVVLALSHSRTGPGLTQLDLLDASRVEAVFGEFKPDWVIHCAAERRPDVAAKVRPKQPHEQTESLLII
jgi:S-adenosylmethionine synthetase